jgi:hypothetical protein
VLEPAEVQVIHLSGDKQSAKLRLRVTMPAAQRRHLLTTEPVQLAFVSNRKAVALAIFDDEFKVPADVWQDSKHRAGAALAVLVRPPPEWEQDELAASCALPVHQQAEHTCCETTVLSDLVDGLTRLSQDYNGQPQSIGYIDTGGATALRRVPANFRERGRLRYLFLTPRTSCSTCRSWAAQIRWQAQLP